MSLAKLEIFNQWAAKENIVLFRSENPSPLVSLMDLATGQPDARKTVLSNRFLCTGGGMLFVGPSGIGKSSASVQQDLLWGLGRPAFGIVPARPLNILTVQAENDAEDLAEMREGVCRGLNLTEKDRQALRGRVFYESECGRTGTEFLEWLDTKLSQGQFDLLRIDPLLAYLGGDVNNAEHTAAFLRAGLNPLLEKHEVACILNHHTPKVTNRDTSKWRPSDWMYSGAGSADITNWARAILVIEPTHDPRVFKFVAAKRGTRIGWNDHLGNPEWTRHFSHALGTICWQESTDEEVQAAAMAVKGPGKGVVTPAHIMGIVPPKGSIGKRALIEEARTDGMYSKTSVESVLAKMIEAGQLELSYRPRKGTNAEPCISRPPQREFTDTAP